MRLASKGPLTWRRALLAFGVVTLWTCVIPRPVEAGVSVDCAGSAAAYRQQGIPCDCVGGRIVCDDGSSGGGSASNSHSGGLSSSNAMKLQIMQSVMDSAANAFIRWVNEPAPTQRAPTPQEIAAQKEQQEQAAAEWRAKVQQQIKSMESQYQQQQRQKVDASKSRLLAGLKGLGGDTADHQSSALQQLRCKAYLGMEAAKASLEEATQFSSFSDNLDAAALAKCDQALPQPPMPSAADDFRVELYQAMVDEINQRLPLIEQAKEKQHSAENQLASKQQQVEELKSRQVGVVSPADQQETDDLLAAALQELDAATTLKNEADAGVMKLKLEVDALKEVEAIAANTNSSPKKEVAP